MEGSKGKMPVVLKDDLIHSSVKASFSEILRPFFNLNLLTMNLVERRHILQAKLYRLFFKLIIISLKVVTRQRYW